MPDVSPGPPGTRQSPPTSKDVAALAGVSQSTVSYVLTGRRPISPQTRRRVEEAMRTLGFAPHAGARALRGRRTGVVALLVRVQQHTDTADTWPYVDAVVAAARARDHDVVLVTDGPGPDDLVRLARRRVCDAMVVMDVRGDDDRLAAAASLDLPVVLVGTPDDAHGLPHVDVDPHAAATALVRHLAATGHRRAVLVGETASVRAQGYRFVDGFHRGVVETCAAVGLRCEHVVPGRPGPAGLTGDAGLVPAVLGSPLPTGVVARSAQAASAVAQVAWAAALVPGRDFSLVALCTDAAATAQLVPVTSVSPAPQAVVDRAMQVLFARLDATDAPTATAHVLGPGPVVPRASTMTLHVGG